MSRNKIELVCGVLLIAMPFTGFPTSFRTAVYIFIGLVFITISFIGHMRRRSNVVMNSTEDIHHTHVEHAGPQQNTEQQHLSSNA